MPITSFLALVGAVILAAGLTVMVALSAQPAVVGATATAAIVPALAVLAHLLRRHWR